MKTRWCRSTDARWRPCCQIPICLLPILVRLLAVVSLPCALVNHFLKSGQKHPCMGSIHLCVVELERDRKFIPKPSLSVSSPYHKRVIENPTIHANGSVNLCVYNGRCANNHTFVRQVPVSAAFSNLQYPFQRFSIRKCTKFPLLKRKQCSRFWTAMQHKLRSSPTDAQTSPMNGHPSPTDAHSSSDEYRMQRNACNFWNEDEDFVP